MAFVINFVEAVVLCFNWYLEGSLVCKHLFSFLRTKRKEMRPILSDLFNSKVKEPAIRPKFLVLLVPTSSWDCYIKNGGDGEKSGLVLLRMFSFERSTAGAFAVTFRVLSPESMTGDQNTGSWSGNSWGFLQNFPRAPVLFAWESLSGLRAAGKTHFAPP